VLDEYVRRHGGESTVAGRTNQVKCNTCGAIVLLEDKVAADRCPYCASFIENKPEAAEAMIPPECMLPFRVESKQAIDEFTKWLGSLWFAPNSLKQFANLGRLNGVYVPFWTFDSMTYTFYRGERGDDYQETEYYTASESYVENGETKTRQVQKSRTVTKTRWTPVSGEVSQFFADVAVCASESIPQKYANALTSTELKSIEPFRSEYLSGFTTERYRIGPKEGFETARQIMDVQIRQSCMRAIGGDHQRLHVVNTQHVGVTFKHLLMPIWLASYRYQDKAYRVMVNGTTGKVMGDRPYSWVKITALVLAILLAVLTVLGLIMLFSKGSGQGQHGEAPAPAVYCEMSEDDGGNKGDEHALVSLAGIHWDHGALRGDVHSGLEGGRCQDGHHAEGADVDGRLRQSRQTRRRRAASPLRQGAGAGRRKRPEVRAADERPRGYSARPV
jgi:hypothetical protein